ncbi:hypothetical protein V2J09_021715, partial [Rumex salicifolius]
DDNQQNQEGQEVVEEEEKEEEQVQEQQQEEEEQYKGENKGKVEHQQQPEEPAIFYEPMMDAFVDATSSYVVEAAKELAEAQTSVTDTKELDEAATKVEELVEAQTSVIDVKESNYVATRAEGVKHGKTLELEAKHEDVVDDVKDAKSNEKKGVVEESKSAGSSSKNLPMSKSDSERTTSDQATSTKKSRCPGDFTPPSFDLGIDAIFDYATAVGKEVVISTTHKETSCECVQQIAQETKASKIEEHFITPAVNKRLPKLSSYVNLIVKATDMERRLFLWTIDSANDEKEKVFECEGYHCNREVFQSLDINAYISDDVISIWARLLNHNEIMKAVESHLRIFCPIMPLVSVNFF